MASFSDDCHICELTEPKNGRPRFWCVAHQSSATARFGGRLDRCEGAYRTIANHRRFKLDPSEFAGGVALWGAVGPVYNTTKLPPERGIHVHARRTVPGAKQIDETFDAVEVSVKRDLLDDEKVLITSETAVAYYLSKFANQKIETIFCIHCGEAHLDSDWFSVKPHRRHLCHNCNKIFSVPDRSVSNPLAAVQLKFMHKEAGKVKRAKEALSIVQSDYPGGLQIWASNPAILWTSSRAEEEGIHIHGWKGHRSKPELDGTYDSVEIDGIKLDEEQLRHFMAQNALTYLRNKIQSLSCPECSVKLFHRGAAAFRPAELHTCSDCGFSFESPGKRRLLVSNPFVDTLKALRHANGKKGEAS